jgi:uncharacterized protein (TIGR02145 family)
MSNITPSKPSFVLGYWRPWKEDSNAIDSYLDYVKDTKLAKYTADTVGKYIAKASRQQVGAINNLGRQLGNGLEIISDEIYKASNLQVSAITNLENQIGAGMDLLQNKLSDISSELNFLNRNNEILIEQQKLSNLLLQNISELLRVPDSEKERQHAIELGIKFFVNAKKDADLYDDALKYLLKAEEIYEEDYFVLHRLGLIYLHVIKHIDIQKAHDYFERAAKYASVESDPEAIRSANALINVTNVLNNNVSNSIQIGTQLWTTKNLNVSKYRNGHEIPQVQDAAEWAALQTGAWCYYENLDENGTSYGKLYNWYAVNDPRGLAPEGFLIPSDEDWITLINYLGGESVAGGKMKENGTAHWKEPNQMATNSSGFKGLPGGFRCNNGNFFCIGVGGLWWSTSDEDRLEGEDNGDNQLVGDIVDQIIIDWLADEFNIEEGIDLRFDPMSLLRIKEAVKKAKIELASFAETEINLPYVTATASGPKHLVKKLTRAKIEQLSDSLIKRSTTHAIKGLNEAAGYRINNDSGNTLSGSSEKTYGYSVRCLTEAKKINVIEHLTAESFEKAAFASYVLGDFEAAVSNQTKALNYNNTAQNYFSLAKYQARKNDINSCILNLELAIDNNPIMLIAVFSEIELLNEPEVIHLIEKKDSAINDEIAILINEFKKIKLEKANEIISELNILKGNRYDLKLIEFRRYSSLLIELNQIESNDKILNVKIDELIQKWKLVASDDFQKSLQELIDLKNKNYDGKEKLYNQFLEKYNSQIKLLGENKDKLKELKSKINYRISSIKELNLCTFTKEDIEKTIEELTLAKDLPLEQMEKIYDKINYQIECDKLKIGSSYQGGIVFYIDKSGKHGLICAKKDLPEACWGTKIDIKTKDKLGTGRDNSQIILNEASTVMGGFLGLTRKPLLTAARLCLELDSNGYNDWYLPSLKELELMYKNLHLKKKGGFRTFRYWSSTISLSGSNLSYEQATCFDFFDGQTHDDYRSNNVHNVRPIRAF